MRSGSLLLSISESAALCLEIPGNEERTENGFHDEPSFLSVAQGTVAEGVNV